MKPDQISNILYTPNLTIGDNRRFALFAQSKSLTDTEIANLALKKKANPDAYVELVQKALDEGKKAELQTYNTHMDHFVLDEIMHSKGGARRKTIRRRKTKCRRTIRRRKTKRSKK